MGDVVERIRISYSTSLVILRPTYWMEWQRPQSKPWGALELGWPFTVVFHSGKGVRNMHRCVSQLGISPFQQEDLTLGKAVPLSEGYSQENIQLWGVSRRFSETGRIQQESPDAWQRREWVLCFWRGSGAEHCGSTRELKSSSVRSVPKWENKD